MIKSYFSILMVLLCISCKTDKHNAFKSNWHSADARIWIGPEYWSNPMQDWKVENGRLSCIKAGENRSVHLLTHSLNNEEGKLKNSVVIGIPSSTLEANVLGWAGFIIGAQGEFNDYRDAAVYGKGISAGITTNGALFIGDHNDADSLESVAEALQLIANEGIALQLSIESSDNENYKIELRSYRPGNKKTLQEVSTTVPKAKIQGNLAIQSHVNAYRESGELSGFWFENWEASGSKLAHHPEHAFGPVLFTMYTLSRSVMKLTAQLPPIAKSDPHSVSLEILSEGKVWEKIAEEPIDEMARTATFRIENWNERQDVPYRVTYDWSPDGKKPKTWFYEGTIKKDPAEKEEIVVAAFTGNNDLGFPNVEVTNHVMKHKPDLLVYTGDQIYEPRGGFGHTYEPMEVATLDYLRKWYMFGWEYGSMLKDIPSVCLPDDHDVYHGNIWGSGGKEAKWAPVVSDWHDNGGFKLPAEWVNMVQRTQTAHMPDPYDPTPVLQNISVYYTDMHVGGISFAIIEDRKWKSAPRAILPESLNVRNGWALSSRFVDPKILDVPADLLGKRQLDFLHHWIGDWSNEIIMKCAISQTIFSTLATLPDSAQNDAVVSKLRITKVGEYPENDIPTQDMDSNGWPKKGRDEAVRIIRKAFAPHIAGDQHLASTIQYGLDEWGDASYAICVPSISNYFPRRWFPKTPGKNRKSGDPAYLGDFNDGFGNKMTVLAVANPVETGLSPARLYDRSAGYGIIKFNKITREIELSNWPRQTDPSQQGAMPYTGWPIKISQEDNYSRKAVAWLPKLEFSGTPLPPVVKITNEATGELEYAIRIKENSFRPKVFAKGTYTIETGEPGTAQWKVKKRVSSIAETDASILKIEF